MKFSNLLVVVGLTTLLLQGCASTPSEKITMMKSDVDLAYMGDCRRIPKNTSGYRQRDLTTTNARCFSKTDIERTGSIDIADALRKLDPSIH